MEIRSAGICRANGLVYEKLLWTDAPTEATLCVTKSSGGIGDAPSLHCMLFELDEPSDERAFVAACPIVPGLERGMYSLGAIDRHGHVLETCARTLDFKTAKWESRKNYRLHKGLCNQIRCYEESHEPAGSTRIVLDKVIGAPEHMVVRLSALTPHTGDNRIAIRVLGHDLRQIDAIIPMGRECIPTRVSDEVLDFKASFSIRVPWDQQWIVVEAWDESAPEIVSVRLIHRDQLDAEVARTERLFMHAGADPYYPEWLARHRITAREMELERGLNLAHEPLFSIIVPLFKTPEPFFREMLASVLAQTYANWELILVNASPEEGRLCELVDEACARDKRVRRVGLESNQGISLNTNAGIEVARGDFVSFFDHDDVLEPDLLFEYAKAIGHHNDIDLLYCDEDKLGENGEYYAPYFKPDFNLDLLRCNNYVCHMLTIRKSLLDVLEPNTPEFDGAQDHNLTLEAVERARHVWHVPRVLYHWRVSATSTAANADSKPYANAAGIRAVSAHLERMGIRAEVARSRFPFTYAVHYLPPEPHPLVSVIIPTSDHIEMLRRCLDSIFKRTTYSNFEVLLIENNSVEPETFAYYEEVSTAHPNRVRVVTWEGGFNFSKLVNFGVREARGDYLLLLNNDTEVITPEWMDRLVGICAREDVGAAGALLWYPDDTIQHAGIVVTNKDAGHFMQDMPRSNNYGYFNLANCQRDLSAVTGACLMTTREAFEAVGGFEESLEVAFNDVDFCLKLREKGLLVVYTPEVELYHYESVSRGADIGEEKLLRNHRERAYLYSRWVRHYAHSDPYYTPNLRETIELARYYHF